MHCLQALLFPSQFQQWAGHCTAGCAGVHTDNEFLVLGLPLDIVEPIGNLHRENAGLRLCGWAAYLGTFALNYTVAINASEALVA